MDLTLRFKVVIDFDGINVTHQNRDVALQHLYFIEYQDCQSEKLEV